MATQRSGLGVVGVLVGSVMLFTGASASHAAFAPRAPLPPIPTVAFSSRGLATVQLIEEHGFILKPQFKGDEYLLGEFVTVDRAGRHHHGDTIPEIHILETQSLRDQWLTLVHEKVHMALWARGVALPDDLEEKVCEAIAKERVAEMEWRDTMLVKP